VAIEVGPERTIELGAVEGDLDFSDWASCESPFEVDKDVRLVPVSG